jgi:RNA polymerase subunit RPABC4/transcription elongation factor Spt4
MNIPKDVSLSAGEMSSPELHQLVQQMVQQSIELAQATLLLRRQGVLTHDTLFPLCDELLQLEQKLRALPAGQPQSATAAVQPAPVSPGIAAPAQEAVNPASQAVSAPTCPRCGAVLRPNKPFCSTCGFRLPAGDALPDDASPGGMSAAATAPPALAAPPVGPVSPPVAPPPIIPAVLSAPVPAGVSPAGAPAPAAAGHCTQCGNLLQEDALFCTYCGQPLTAMAVAPSFTAPPPAAVVSSPMVAPPVAAGPVTQYCDNCGRGLTADTTVCPDCGGTAFS